MNSFIKSLEMIISFALFVSAFNFVSSFEAPDISFTSWIGEDYHNVFTDIPPPVSSYKPNVYVVPSRVSGLTISCNASYPVKWDFKLDKFQYHMKSIALVRTIRNATDIFDDSTFRYSAQLTLWGGANYITGNYSCQAVNNDQVSSIYIFWEGSSPPYILGASNDLHLTVLYYNDTADSIILPCLVSRPDVKVTLLKTNAYANKSNPVPQSSYTYDPMVGFKLMITGRRDIIGTYVCYVDLLTERDFMHFSVVPSKHLQKKVVSQFLPQGNPPGKEFNATMLYNASVHYDSSRQSIVCCSITKDPPKMMQYMCDHPITCEMRRHALHSVEGNANRKTNGSCSNIKLAVATPGVFRCVGVGIDIIREYVFPFKHIPISSSSYSFRMSNFTDEPYMSWDAIDSTKMMTIISNNEKLYAGQSVKFDCAVSPYYFSQGVHWMITMKNRTNIVVAGKVAHENTKKLTGFQLMFLRNQVVIQFVANTSLESITCFAPVWNTSEWKKQTILFNVSEPITPVTEGETLVEEYWYVNETGKQLQCTFTGMPMPGIYWLKGNTSLKSTGHVTTENGTSTLSIPIVSYETHGIYKCGASNVGGVAEKIFHIYVKERLSTGLVTVLVFTVLGCVAAAGGVVYLMKRMKEQKKKIEHLTQVAFKDVDMSSSVVPDLTFTAQQCNNATKVQQPDTDKSVEKEDPNSPLGEFNVEFGRNGDYHKF